MKLKNVTEAYSELVGTLAMGHGDCHCEEGTWLKGHEQAICEVPDFGDAIGVCFLPADLQTNMPF
tara:strand:- start:950 stop:1144 length:195 start_codon:yes stop_codon:yes gene_type:complete